jgi:hypothetical protein
MLGGANGEPQIWAMTETVRYGTACDRCGMVEASVNGKCKNIIKRTKKKNTFNHYG